MAKQQFGDWIEIHSVGKKLLTFAFAGGQTPLNIYPPFEFGEGFIVGGIHDAPDAPQKAICYELVVSVSGSEPPPAGSDFERKISYPPPGIP